MSTQVTVTLPDEVYRRAIRRALLTERSVEEVLAATLEDWFTKAGDQSDAEAVETLPDNRLLALADSLMDADQNSRMSALLEKQQAEEMTEAERRELSMLVDIYQEGSLLKARAMVEAIRRGLREPLKP